MSAPVVFAGGPRGSTWATIGEVVARMLAAHGRDVQIDATGSVERNPRLVASGEALFGATNPTAVRGAFQGAASYKGEAPRTNLRMIAAMRQPNWEGFAIRAELGITDLSQIAERRPPLRLIGGDGHTQVKVWQHYGLSLEEFESWGGKSYGHPGAAPDLERVVRDGEFDMIVTPISAGYSPDTRHWHQATLRYDLRFLPVPADVIAAVCQAMPGGEPGFIPHDLYRGVEADTPAVCRPWRVLITTEAAPDDLVYALASELDRQRHLFQQTHLMLSYDLAWAASDQGIPLHPAAERFYRERGVL